MLLLGAVVDVPAQVVQVLLPGVWYSQRAIVPFEPDKVGKVAALPSLAHIVCDDGDTVPPLPGCITVTSIVFDATEYGLQVWVASTKRR